MLQTLEEGINLNKMKGACHVTVRNAFFANYVTALLLLKLQDLKGLMVINDHKHSMLTKFSPHMSDLNYWGRALFHANEAEVKNRMEAGEARVLAASAARILPSRIQKIMKVPLTAPDAVDWNEALASILLAANLFGLKSSYFNNVTRALYKWDSIDVAAKHKAVNDSLMFMIQSDSSAVIIPHLRKLSTDTMTGKLGSVAQKIVGFSKLNEDGEGGGAAPAGTSTANIGSSNAIVSPGGSAPTGNSQSGFDNTSQDVQQALGGLYKLVKMSSNQITKKGRFTIRNGKLVKKKVKDFAPKKFKAPDFLKPKKQEKKDAA